MSTDSIQNRWLRVRQVADYFSVSPATIWRWLETRDFPKPVKIGPRVTAWRVSDVAAYGDSLQAPGKNVIPSFRRGK